MFLTFGDRTAYTITYRLSPRGKVLVGTRFYTPQDDPWAHSLAVLDKESNGRGVLVSVEVAAEII